MEEGDPVVLPEWVARRVRECREVLGEVCSKLESQVARNADLPPVYREIVRKGFAALALLDGVAKMGPLRAAGEQVDQDAIRMACTGQPADAPVVK